MLTKLRLKYSYIIAKRSLVCYISFKNSTACSQCFPNFFQNLKPTSVNAFDNLTNYELSMPLISFSIRQQKSNATNLMLNVSLLLS